MNYTTKMRSLIEDMSERREIDGVVDDPERKLEETLRIMPLEMRDIVRGTERDPKKVMLILHNNVCTYRDVTSDRRVRILQDAISQNSSETIKAFLQHEWGYSVSLWYAYRRRTDVDNVMMMLLNALHRCPVNANCPENVYEGGVFPVMRDDSHVTELHVYRNWCNAQAIPIGMLDGVMYVRVERVHPEIDACRRARQEV